MVERNMEERINHANHLSTFDLCLSKTGEFEPGKAWCKK